MKYLLLSVLLAIALPGVAKPPGTLLYENRIPAAYRAAFVAQVNQSATRLGIEPDWLMIVMYYETGGSYRADVVNRYSGAVGLIQFIPSTARRMGTTCNELSRMNAPEQLRFVERYFQPYKGLMNDVYDVYIVVFAPAWVGFPDGTTLYRADAKTALGKRRYRYNRGFDTDHDGRITIADVKRQIRRFVPAQS